MTTLHQSWIRLLLFTFLGGILLDSSANSEPTQITSAVQLFASAMAQRRQERQAAQDRAAEATRRQQQEQAEPPTARRSCAAATAHTLEEPS